MRNRLRASHISLLPTVIRAVNGNLANNFSTFPGNDADGVGYRSTTHVERF